MPTIRQTLPMTARNEAVINGRTVRFTPTECRILTTLLLRRGLATSMGDLIAIIYDDGEREPDGAQTTMQVMICRINRKAGVRIVRYDGNLRGYLLED